jgi:hypothetical protein
MSILTEWISAGAVVAAAVSAFFSWQAARRTAKAAESQAKATEVQAATAMARLLMEVDSPNNSLLSQAYNLGMMFVREVDSPDMHLMYQALSELAGLKQK